MDGEFFNVLRRVLLVLGWVDGHVSGETRETGSTDRVTTGNGAELLSDIVTLKVGECDVGM